MLGNQNATGFMRIYIIDQETRENLSNATITIYVTDGMRRDVPVGAYNNNIKSCKVELPMANILGTQIAGPEYDFSTYNLRVDAFGYFANLVFNIRLFPNVTTDFVIEMAPITVPQPVPIIEERLDIPPHPRDIVP